MQTFKQSIAETIVTLFLDNINNVIIIYLAYRFYNIELKTSLSLLVIAQVLNFSSSILRRRYFNRHYNGIDRA